MQHKDFADSFVEKPMQPLALVNQGGGNDCK